MFARLVSRPRRQLMVGALFLCVSGCGGGTDAGPAVTTPVPRPVTPVLTTLNLGVTAADLKASRTRQILATTLDQNAQPITASIVWSSSASAIATVSVSGLVTAIAPGVASITATATAGSTTLTGVVVITVSALAVTSVTVSPATLVLVQGSMGALTALVVGDSGVSTGVVWGTSNALAAGVGTTGTVSATGLGNAQVCAISVIDSAMRGCSAVTVTAVAVASVTVTPPSLTMLLGQTATLGATTRDANGNTLTGRVVSWSSGNAAIATVSQVGVVSAVGLGTVTISAASEGRTGTATVTATIAEPSVTGVAVGPLSTSITVGQSVQLSASVSGTNNPPINVTWASADATKVTVNQNGFATGVGVTTGTQVCATSVFDSSKRGCGSVIVTPISFPSVATVSAPAFTFNPALVDIALAGTVTFTFTAIAHNVIFNATPGAPANVSAIANASVSRQFNTVGTFNYQCTLHAGMTATVVVH